MAAKPEAPRAQNFIPVDGMVEAPIIYFETCPTFGNNGDIINIMLAANLMEPTAGIKARKRLKAVAHLRVTHAAAAGLRDIIDRALLIGTPVENPSGKTN